MTWRIIYGSTEPLPPASLLAYLHCGKCVKVFNRSASTKSLKQVDNNLNTLFHSRYLILFEAF